MRDVDRVTIRPAEIETMNDGTCLCADVDQSRIQMRLDTGYLDKRADTLDEALAIIDAATGAGEAVSVGLLGNAAEILAVENLDGALVGGASLSAEDFVPIVQAGG